MAGRGGGRRSGDDGVGAMRACRACAAASPASSRFCGMCGLRLDETIEEGERKLATVLSADIKDSFAMIRDRSADDAHRILRPVGELLIDAARLYEGSVCQYQGDGVLALFGAPSALEDHADLACYAALEMLRRLARHNAEQPQDSRVSLRIGISSGEIVVERLTLHDITVVIPTGPTVHMACRMQQLAPPDGIWLTAATGRLLTRHFATASVGRVEVKGLEERVEVWSLAAGDASEPRTPRFVAGLRSPFVGREAERRALEAAVARAKDERRLSAVVIGHAGVGKSRLLHEILASGEAASCHVLRGGCLPHGAARPWLPILALLRDLFGIRPGERAPEVRKALEARLGQIDPSFGELLAPLGACLELPDFDADWAALDVVVKQRRIADALHRLFRRLAEDRTLLLVLEDLHDADDATLSFLTDWMSGEGPCRALVLATARPGFEIPWAEAGAGTCGDDHGQPNGRTLSLTLEPLPEAAAVTLVSELVGMAPGMAELARQLAARTGGNPLFIEESVRDLIDAGRLVGAVGDLALEVEVADLPLPASVQATLEARADRLLVDDKKLLRAAAVLGVEFDPMLLASIVRRTFEEVIEGLTRLAQSDFLAAQDAERSWRFRHALIQETAYKNHLADRRRELHGRAAEVLARRPGHGETRAALAHHALEAAMWPEAFAAYRELALYAVSRSAMRDALKACRQAARALVNLPWVARRASELQLELIEADAHFVLGQRSEVSAHLEDAENLARELNDAVQTAQILSRRSLLHWTSGEVDAAIAAARQTLEIATRQDDVPLRVNAEYRLGAWLMARGDYAGAHQRFAAAIEAIPPGAEDQRFGLTLVARIAAESAMARCLGELDRFDEGCALADSSRAAAADLRHPFSELYVAQEIGLLYIRMGDAGRAIEALEHGRSLVRDVEGMLLYPMTLAELGYAHVLAGHKETGLSLLEEAVERGRKMRLVPQAAQHLGMLAEAHLAHGNLDRARSFAEESLSLATARGERGDTGWILLSLARISLAQGAEGAREASGWLVRAHQAAHDMGMPTLERAVRKMDLDELPSDLRADRQPEETLALLARRRPAPGPVSPRLEPHTRYA